MQGTSSKKTLSRSNKTQEPSSLLSRNKISRYFKPTSDNKTTEIAANKSENVTKCATVISNFNLNLSNFSDNVSFEPPKPVKTASFFQSKLKGGGRATSKQAKKKNTNRKLSEETRKFLYNEGTDVNEDHLQLAIALSKSIQEEENPFPNTQEKIAIVKNNLQRFEYKSSKTTTTNENSEFFLKPSNPRSKKNQLVRLGSALLHQTEEERRKKIRKNFKKILLKTPRNLEEKSSISPSFEFILRGINLNAFYCHGKTLYKKASYSQNEELSNFYVEGLVEQSSVKVGYLLYDWNRIIGRDKSPIKENKSEEPSNMESQNITSVTAMERSIRSISPDLFNASDALLLNISNHKDIKEICNDDDIIVCESYEDDDEVLSQPSINRSEKKFSSECSNRAVENKNISEHSVNIVKFISDLPQCSNENNQIGSSQEIYDLTQSSTSSMDSVEAQCNTFAEESSDSFDLPEVNIVNSQRSNNSQKLSQGEKRQENFSKKLKEIETVVTKFNKPAICTPKSLKRYHSVMETSKDELDSTLLAFNFNNVNRVEPTRIFEVSQSNTDKSLKKYHSFVETLQDEFESSMIQEVNQKVLNLNDKEAILSDSDDIVVIDDEEINYSCNQSFRINQRNSPIYHKKTENKSVTNSSRNKRIYFNDEYAMEDFTQGNQQDYSSDSDAPVVNELDTKSSKNDNLDDFERGLNLDYNPFDFIKKRKGEKSEEKDQPMNTSVILSPIQPVNINARRTTWCNKEDLEFSGNDDNHGIATQKYLANCSFKSSSTTLIKEYEKKDAPKNTTKSVSPIEPVNKSRGKNICNNKEDLKFPGNHANNDIYRQEYLANCSFESSSTTVIEESEENDQPMNTTEILSPIQPVNKNAGKNTWYNKEYLEFSGNDDNHGIATQKYLAKCSFKPSSTTLIKEYEKKDAPKYTTKSVSPIEPVNKSRGKNIRSNKEDLEFPGNHTNNDICRQEYLANCSFESSSTTVIEEDSPSKPSKNDVFDDSFERCLNLDHNPFDFTQKECSEPVKIPVKDAQHKKVLTPNVSKFPNEMLDKTNGSNAGRNLVHNKSNDKAIATPNREVVKIFHNITPMPQYDCFDTPKINLELNKFGLKRLGRKKGVKILRHIYEQTHPFISEKSKTPNTTSCEQENSPKRRKIDLEEGSSCFKTFRTEFGDLNIDIAEEVKSARDSDQDLIFERQFSTKIYSCRLPFHIAWHNFVLCNPEIRRQILKYEPLQVEPIYTHFRNIGLKFHKDDIVKFLDRRCITIRTNSNAQRNKRNPRNK